MNSSSSLNNKTIGILLLAGKGERFNSLLPKQFHFIDGKPLFVRALKTMDAENFDLIILAVEHGYEPLVDKVVKQENLKTPYLILEGSNTRSNSVKEAINYLMENNYGDDNTIFIHDADRPFASSLLYQRLEKAAKEHSCLIPVLKVEDSVVESLDQKQVNIYLKRDNTYRVQTPQVFKLGLLKTSFSLLRDQVFTDEGSLVLMMIGVKPHLIEGEIENIKINTHDDLKLLEDNDL